MTQFAHQTAPGSAPIPYPARPVAARAVDIVKTYGSGSTTVHALAGVTVELYRGEFTAIMGPSGSGKSTLMHCLAGLDIVTSGSVAIGDIELAGLSDKKMTALRRDRVGFVFQAFNLVPTLTALENITLPIDIAGRRPDQQWLDTVIDTLGLRDRLSHRPSELSGGQQQRVAVRPGAGVPAGDRLRRRADRQPRLPFVRARCWASCAVGRRAGPDGRDRDPRPAGRRLRRPGGVPGRRPRSSDELRSRPRTGAGPNEGFRRH